MLDENLTLVTNDWSDFRPMLQRLDVHPGIVVIVSNVRRERQIELFADVLTAMHDHQPPRDMINTVVEVDGDGTVTMFALPSPEG